MTREEEIENAKRAFYERVLQDDYYYAPRDCFEEGAKWADANPKSQWISVEDDLPYRHKELLSDEFCTKYVFVLIDKHITNKLSMRNDKIMGWQWGQHFNVTHWMPIPKLDE